MHSHSNILGLAASTCLIVLPSGVNPAKICVSPTVIVIVIVIVIRVQTISGGFRSLFYLSSTIDKQQLSRVVCTMVTNSKQQECHSELFKSARC